MKKWFLSLIIALLAFYNSITFSHSGRTDSFGGHWDRKYGTGYHYHHGMPAHQHPNGICPYQQSSSQNSNNNEIMAIQQKLTELGYNPGHIDGILGPKTKEAIKQFQKDNGLVVDGICGPKTKAKLGL